MSDETIPNNGKNQKVLASGEKVIYAAEFHKIIYAFPICWIYFGASILWAGRWFDFFSGLFFMLVGLCGLAISIYRSMVYELAVTNQRVVMVTGPGKSNFFNCPLNQVKKVEVTKKGFFKDVELTIKGPRRIWNYEAVRIIGEKGKSPQLKRIADPLEFKAVVEKEKSRHGTAHG